MQVYHGMFEQLLIEDGVDYRPHSPKNCTAPEKVCWHSW